MRRHTIELTERELRVVLTAFDILRGEAGPLPDSAWRTWNSGHRDTLYQRLLSHGLTSAQDAANGRG